MASAMYLRKSRADDAGESVEATIARHKKILSEFADKNGIAIAESYEEVVTGDGLFVRPEMLRLLQDVEAGRYESVLCMDIDRLGRGGQKDAGIILEAFKYSGTKIATLDKTYDLENELDEELAEFKTFMSRRELKIITKRLRRGLRETVREGAYIANAPYGYEKTVIDRRPSLKIKESEAYFVRMIFDLYVNQGLGCASIAETLNSLGAKPRRADHFYRTSVQHILCNPAMCGKIVWDRTKWIRKGKFGNDRCVRLRQPEDAWIVAKGLHEPIISEELFRQAQQIYHGRYHPPCNDGTIRNPLSGLVFCARCKKPMQMHRRNAGTPYAYLRCFTKGCCPAARLEHVEEALLRLLDLELRAPHVPPAGQEPADLERALSAVKKEIALAQRQKDNLHDFLEQGVYSPETFLERRAALEAKLDSLREMELSRQTALDRLFQARPEAETLLQYYRRAAPAQKNALLKSMISQVAYEKEPGAARRDFSLTVYWNPRARD